MCESESECDDRRTVALGRVRVCVCDGERQPGWTDIFFFNEGQYV